MTSSTLRILVLSAPVGEGHVAAGRALAERMRTLWPDASVHEVESTGGRGRDRLLATAYSVVMRRAPVLYGFGYDLLVHSPRFAKLCKQVSGMRLAHDVEPLVREHSPDLVLSTYPMTTGGLARLRRRGRLDARSVAVVTDVAVHPFWVWAGIDETWTLLESSRRQAAELEPAADVRVMPPVVAPTVHPRDRAAARRATGLADDTFVVLVSGGSLAFGGLETLTDAVLESGAVAVVLCGRDDRLRARLAGRPESAAGRLHTLGWTDRVPELLAAVDVTLTTAGGMLATESLSVGTPVLFAAPVPGHGRVGAAMTADAGLALVCNGPAEVTEALRQLREEPDARARLAARTGAFADRDLDAALRDLVDRARED